MLTDEEIKNMSEAEFIRLLVKMERLRECRLALVTRSDVNSQFGEMLFNSDQPRRDMTEDEWERFASNWFWSKGYSEIFWDGCIWTAVDDDLTESLFTKAGLS